MIEIKINAPGAGEWIMSQIQGSFVPGFDHSFSSHRDGQILGGIVVGAFAGQGMTAHMAGNDPHWFSRELAWLAFDYAFNQVGCHKMVAGVRSDNRIALAIDLRGGWRMETVIKDLFAPGVDMVVLGMTRETCKWLDYQPKRFRSNIESNLTTVVNHHG